MTTMRSGSAALLAITLLVAGTAAAEENATPGQKQSGFVLQVSVDTRMVNVYSYPSLAGLAYSGTTGTLQGGFLLGYKIDRVIVGAGLNLSRFANTQSNGAGGTLTTSDTLVEIVPGLQVALARSADARVELFGGLDLGFGHVFVGGGSETANFTFRFAVGPGIRYWVHPQFAIAALTALEGRFGWSGSSGAVGDQGSNQLSILAGLRCLGVF